MSQDEDTSVDGATIKYIGVFNQQSKKRVCSLSLPGYPEKNYEFEGESFAQNKSKVLPVDSRVTSENEKGRWTLYKISRELCVYGCFGSEYRDRVAAKLLKELGEIISAIPGAENMAEPEFKVHFKQNGSRILDNYKDQSEVDAVLKADKKTKEVQQIALKRMGELVKDGEDLERLQNASKKAKDLASQYEKNTKDIKDEMTWRNRKGLLFMGASVVVGGGVLYLLKTL